MTDLDLRKIAEHLDVGWDVEQFKKNIAFLLNAVVEEKAWRRELEWNRHKFNYGRKYVLQDNKWIKNSHFNWTHDDWLTQALRELNLKGVWPGKEGE